MKAAPIFKGLVRTELLLEISYPYIAYQYIAYFPLAGIVLGLIIGSYLATIVVRWPQGLSASKGRSRCDSCGTVLTIGNLIRVLSFVFQRGKCGHCDAKIGTDHIAIELSAALIGGLAMVVEPGLGGLLGAIFGWLLLTLAVLDAKHHWLPDILTFLLAMTGLTAAIFVAQPNLTERLIGGISGFGALFVIGYAYRAFRGRDGLGGGDAKMLGAIGCWLGWQMLPMVLLGAASVGLISALIMSMRGEKLASDTALPLGSFMALSAFPIWLYQAGTGGFSI